MARNQSSGSAPAPVNKATPPAGFVRVGSVANAPWFNLQAGNTCHGVLQNVYERPDERAKSGRSKFFQIELLSPALCREGKGDDAAVREFPAGTIVNLNHGPKSKELEKFVPEIMRGAVYHVWAHVEGEKFKIARGQTMWPLDVQVQLVTPARATEDVDFEEGDEDEGQAAAG